MKLKFNSDETHEFRNALDGSKMKSLLWDLDQWLRSKLKYEELPQGEYEAYKQTREHLRRLLIEENIDIEQ